MENQPAATTQKILGNRTANTVVGFLLYTYFYWHTNKRDTDANILFYGKRHISGHERVDLLYSVGLILIIFIIIQCKHFQKFLNYFN